MKAGKKTVLVFIDWYLPGFKAGGPIQSCANLVAHLGNDFHFKIVTRDTDYLENVPYPNVTSNQWNKLDEHTEVYYFSSAQLTKKNIEILLATTRFDYVYINGMFSYYFTIIPLWYFRKRSSASIIVAARGMLAKGALAIKSKKKNLFLKASKLLGLFNNVTFHATSEAEKEDIEHMMGSKTTIKIAGNLSKKIDLPAFERKQKQQGSLRLINIARIAPEKNLKFALEIIKEVRQPLEFQFYGPVYDEAYFKECEFLIAQMPAHITIKHLGVIPNNQVNGILKHYDAMLMPTRGENFGHIILESFLASCPVIISDQTPWRNLQRDKAGWDIALADKSAFVNALEELTKSNEDTYNILAFGAYNKAKQFVEDERLVHANKALFS